MRNTGFNIPTPTVRMPYTPPPQRSPAVSAPHSSSLSRRSSYPPDRTSGPLISSRPEPPRSASYLTQCETPSTGSDEEDVTDEDESGRSRRKHQILRKESGKLIRPVLRPSSARRRPLSMPGTPTPSKTVHFDPHLEYARHFL